MSNNENNELTHVNYMLYKLWLPQIIFILIGQIYFLEVEA